MRGQPLSWTTREWRRGNDVGSMVSIAREEGGMKLVAERVRLRREEESRTTAWVKSW